VFSTLLVSCPASAGLFFEGRPVLLLDQADVAAVSRQLYLALFPRGEARPQCDVPMIAIPKRQIDGSPS
jgi:hypothetical protein